MNHTVVPVVIGFVLDLLLGDPLGRWHPVCAIGWLITKGEAVLRRVFPATPKGQLIAGAVLAVMVCGVSFAVPFALLYWLGQVHPWFALGAESLLCWQALAVTSLKKESMLVYHALKNQTLPQARAAVARIVGRDTQSLDEAGVTRAAVETVAENTGDGCVAPLLFLLLGGAPLGFFYKAVNTMDSMIGYRNEAYLFFGRLAARLDDVMNYLPARISALFMIGSAFLLRYNGKNALRIFLRDRYCHKSPNSAQTEAVCAGALGIRLGGDAFYFGKRYEKPTIGDALRPIEPEDIIRANRLMLGTVFLCFAIGVAVKLLF